MGQNTVSGSAHIKFIRQGDSITSILISTAALVQYVNTANSMATPDWAVAANQPVIYPRIVSQLTGNVITSIANPAWKFNNTSLVFGSNGKTADGKFESTTYTVSGVAIPALKICKNIMLDASQNTVISFSGDVTTGGMTYTINADIPVTRSETSGEVYQGYISATNGGIVDDTNTSTTLTAALNKGGAAMTDGVTYAWYYSTPEDTDAVKDNWEPMNKTTKSITVSRDDVDTVKTLKCDLAVNGSVVCSAFFEIRDESDPLYIVTNPNQREEILSSYQPSITYSPLVRRRGHDTNESGWSFNFILSDVKGETVRSSSGISFTVTYQEIVQKGCDLDLYIKATK